MKKTAFGIEDVVGQELASEWAANRGQLRKFLNDVDCKIDDSTVALFTNLLPNEIRDKALADCQRNPVPFGGWAVHVYSPKEVSDFNGCFVAIPTLEAMSEESDHALYLDLHSRLTSWWKVMAWRVLDLSESCWQLGDSLNLHAAAACSRSLLESAASLWSDAIKLQALWDEIKKRGEKEEGRSIKNWLQIQNWLSEVQFGSKFDPKRSPELAKSFSLKRTNVLTHLDKLMEQVSLKMTDDYQWLCNAVHPSIGGTFLHMSSMMMHPTGTHSMCLFSPIGRNEKLNSRETDEVPSIDFVHTAIVRGTVSASHILIQSLDDLLKVIDDVALTTKASRLSTFEYWRRLDLPVAGTPCLCRSGLDAENCAHQWGDSAPSIRGHFRVSCYEQAGPK